MAATLEDLPHDFGDGYIPFFVPLRQRTQASRFAREKYCKEVSFKLKDGDNVFVNGHVYPSQRKHDRPHQTSFVVDKQNQVITEYTCSCQIG